MKLIHHSEGIIPVLRGRFARQKSPHFPFDLVNFTSILAVVSVRPRASWGAGNDLVLQRLVRLRQSLTGASLVVRFDRLRGCKARKTRFLA